MLLIEHPIKSTW